jgi:hypothetical protein
MQLELEGGHHAEIAAAAPQCPEQILVLRLAGANHLCVSRDDIGRDEIIDGQPEFAGGPAEATAKREAGDAGRRIDPKRRGQPKRLRLFVEVRQRSAGLDPSGAGRRIDPHRFHQGEINEETAVAHRIARDVMAAAAHRNEQLFIARELDRIDDIRGPKAPHHQAGPSIDHGVPDGAGGVVAILSRQRDSAAHVAAQGGHSVLRDPLG